LLAIELSEGFLHISGGSELKRSTALLLAIFAWAGLSTAQSPIPDSRPSDNIGKIVVSANGRFFLHKDGRPFFWLGDTAWNLFQKLDRDETERYLENPPECVSSLLYTLPLP
jgi:hypothetical protein